ncbi:MAG: hypothetical protein ACE5GV_05560 [Candidatus Scalindua sp.]
MVWKNVEQINQALDDMCNVFSRLPIEAQKLFAQNMYEFMLKAIRKEMTCSCQT